MTHKLQNTAARTDGAKHRVVIIDDHPLMRHALVEMLQQHLPGLEICGEAEQETTALKLIRQTKPDLALLDLTLDQGPNVELIKQIKQAVPSVRVLVFSLHDEVVYAERSIRAGALGYVCKKAPPQMLIEAIRRVMAGRVHVSPGIADRMIGRLSGHKGGEPQAPTDALSNRELEVLELLGKGKSTRQIGDLLHISVKTVDAHRQRIKSKLGLRNSSELIHLAVEHSLRSQFGEHEEGSINGDVAGAPEDRPVDERLTSGGTPCVSGDTGVVGTPEDPGKSGQAGCPAMLEGVSVKRQPLVPLDDNSNSRATSSQGLCGA